MTIDARLLSQCHTHDARRPHRLAGAAPTYQTVHQSPPLFSQGAMLLDSCVLIWVTISHLLLTFWPLCGLAIMTGVRPSTAPNEHVRPSSSILHATHVL